MNKILNVLLYLLKVFPIDEQKILFIEGRNNFFTGNCRSIFENLKNRSDLKFILISDKEVNKNYLNIKIIKYKSLEMLYHLSTSKYCFFTSTIGDRLYKREKQIYVNLWHAAGAFKKFAYDAELKNLKGKKVNNSIDLVTVSSASVQNIYSNALNVEKNKVKNLGIPRADIFFKEEEKEKIKKNFYKNYPKLENKKIILYTPTYRDSEKNKFNLKLDINLMKKELENKGYILLLKLHPAIKGKDIQVDNKFSYNFSDYSNTADLLIISDILISDYSSIIFEFSIMKKPILFYTYDVEEYIRDRGFYYNYYDFIPNKISYTTEEIIKAIINQEWDLERIEKFAKYFFNPFDGNSTERILKEVGLWEGNK